MTNPSYPPQSPPPTPSARNALKGGRRRTIVRGQDRSRWTDFYQAVLSAPWWMFLSGMALFYFGTNALFAALYLIEPGSIANARTGSFEDAFFFSIQTIGTLGYGVMAPKTFYANVLVSIETFFGILNIAVATGAMFARVSRPTARILFSRHAIVTMFDGVPTLMFRVANQRANQILEADVTVTLARQTVTREGLVMRRFQELKLVRPRTPLFALSWTVMHTIDDASPFAAMNAQSVEDDQIELIAVLGGTDETFSERVYGRYAYGPQDILWNKRFVDVVSVDSRGRASIDLRKFHTVAEMD